MQDLATDKQLWKIANLMTEEKYEALSEQILNDDTFLDSFTKKGKLATALSRMTKMEASDLITALLNKQDDDVEEILDNIIINR